MSAEKESPGGGAAETGRVNNEATSLYAGNAAESQVDFNGIPEGLKQRNHWVAWILAPPLDPKKEKPDKIPINVKTDKGASSTDPKTWAPFDKASAFFEKKKGQFLTVKQKKDGKLIDRTGPVSGVGYVFAKDDPFTGVDLDNCIEGNGKLLQWADDIIRGFDSFTEVSQSGGGVHTIFEGKKPGSSCVKGDIECYDHSRFFAITGRVLNGYTEIKARQKALDAFYQKYFHKSEALPKPPPDRRIYADSKVEGTTVMERIRSSRNAGKIEALLSGENSGHNSASEADQSLCNHLVFFCGNLPDSDTFNIVDAIFRQSGRYRGKWDEPHYSSGETYGEHTILKAIADTITRYQTRNELVLKETEQVAEVFSTQELIRAAYDGQKGAANLFIKLFKNRFVFDHTEGVWYEWQGHFWQAEDIGRPIKECDKIQQAFERVQAELDGEVVLIGQKMKQTTDANEAENLKSKLEIIKGRQKAVSASIKSLNSLAFRKAVVEFAAQGEGSLGISGTEWDLMPWLLPCKNGVIDLKTGKLREGKPEDYLKSVCPTNYDTEACCPQFEQALLDIFNSNIEMVDFWQRVAGMALVGANVEHVLIVLHGAGRNGKDVLLSIFGYVLGPSLAGAVQSELLLDQGRTKSSSGPSADIMRLRGLRLAWASETNEGRRMDAGKIKLLTGGGDLVGRSPYARREISFPQSFSLFLLTNAKPHASADDYALWKRIKLVPFEVQFVDDPAGPNEKQRDKNLLDKLKAEAPGVLAWMVKGCLEWQEIGLGPPAVVEQATNKYRDEEDLLLQFAEDGCITGPDYQARGSDLYAHYRAWMQDNGL